MWLCIDTLYTSFVAHSFSISLNVIGIQFGVCSSLVELVWKCGMYETIGFHCFTYNSSQTFCTFKLSGLANDFGDGTPQFSAPRIFLLFPASCLEG